jgi:hypothetical protein
VTLLKKYAITRMVIGRLKKRYPDHQIEGPFIAAATRELMSAHGACHLMWWRFLLLMPIRLRG